MESVRVLGVDPGYDRVGVAVLEQKNGVETLLYSSCITTNRSDSLTERIFVVGNAISSILSEYKPTILGIETLFFNKNTRTAIGVAQARGVVVYVARCFGCVVREFGPQEIKVAVTGYGKSDKQSVYDMVNRLISGVPKGALDDEYDAIAVGITCLAHERS